MRSGPDRASTTESEGESESRRYGGFENQVAETIPVQIEGVGMGLRERKSIESRFRGYVEVLVGVIGHADRAGPSNGN